MPIKQIIESTPCVWEKLKSAKKPVMLYGMGDGAQKILNACALCGVNISEIFASDGFVRSQEFCGYTVRGFSYIEHNYGDFIILLGFGSSRPEVLQRFYSLNDEYELYAPDVPLIPESEADLFTADYARAHLDELEQAHCLFCDEQSRVVFESVLEFKLSGKIDCLRRCETPREEMFEIIKPRGDEFYIDLGAYNGDTVLEFLSEAHSANKIIAVEPDRKNFKKLCRNLADVPNIFAVNAPVWSGEALLPFSGGASRGSAVKHGGGQTVASVSVDGLLGGKIPSDCTVFGNSDISDCGVTFIKADVEGAEKQALLGAEATIRKFSPRLAVSAYHRNSDLFTLPQLIHRLNPEYKLYLRHHSYVPAWETNIYGGLSPL